MDDALYSYAVKIKYLVDNIFNCNFVEEDSETYEQIYTYIERIKEHAVRNSKT